MHGTATADAAGITDAVGAWLTVVDTTDADSACVTDSTAATIVIALSAATMADAL